MDMFRDDIEYALQRGLKCSDCIHYKPTAYHRYCTLDSRKIHGLIPSCVRLLMRPKTITMAQRILDSYTEVGVLEVLPFHPIPLFRKI